MVLVYCHMVAIMSLDTSTTSGKTSGDTHVKRRVRSREKSHSAGADGGNGRRLLRAVYTRRPYSHYEWCKSTDTKGTSPCTSCSVFDYTPTTATSETLTNSTVDTEDGSKLENELYTNDEDSLLSGSKDVYVCTSNSSFGDSRKGCFSPYFTDVEPRFMSEQSESTSKSKIVASAMSAENEKEMSRDSKQDSRHGVGPLVSPRDDAHVSLASTPALSDNKAVTQWERTQTMTISDMTLPRDLIITKSATSFDSTDGASQPDSDNPSQKTKAVISISDSEECDTDLEIDEKPRQADIPIDDLHIGRNLYTRACGKWRTTPQKAFVDRLPMKSLGMRYRSLSSAAIPPLCAALRDNLRVERLTLDSMDITDESCRFVAEMLQDNITISHVNLANNSLGLHSAQMLGRVMIDTRNIVHLNLSGNKLGNRASWYLSAAIGANTSMLHLDLSYNDFSEQSGKLIGTGLVENRKLQSLNLCWNQLRGKGTVAIFQALMINPTLECLNLSWNGAGYEGAVALSKCLKRNTGLRDLDMSNSRIDWRGAALIADGLRENETLNKLHVGYNPLTTTGVMDILDAVSRNRNSCIRLLDASEVSVLGDAVLLAATMRRRRKFQFIHGGIVSTPDTLGQRLDRAVNPMLNIIGYLRLLGLRPLELMKSFDKNASFELTRKEFVEQIKKIGVKLHNFEIEALANTVSRKGYDTNLINYRKLALAVREVVRSERERKIKEREEWLQIQTYHKTILQKGRLPSTAGQTSSKLGVTATDKVLPAGGDFLSPYGVNGYQKTSALSLCGPLDSLSYTNMNKQKTRKKKVKHKRPFREQNAS